MHTTKAEPALYLTSEPVRARVHDLRNLFAFVGMAKPLLERSLDEERREQVLDALARIALEGKMVTDALLRFDCDDRGCGTDGPAELRSLEPVIKSLERPGLSVSIRADEDASWILMNPAEFRAVALELITNAAAAGAARIEVRAVKRGCRFWLIAADDGCGFPPASTAAQLEATAGVRGTGLRRLASAAGSARGKVKIKSKAGVGSVVAMILPILRLVKNAPELPARARRAG